MCYDHKFEQIPPEIFADLFARYPDIWAETCKPALGIHVDECKCQGVDALRLVGFLELRDE